MTEVWSVDPRTGRRTHLVATSTSFQQVEKAADAARQAAGDLIRLGQSGRSELLRRVAEELDTRGDKLINIADRETGLGRDRLSSELGRTTAQLRMFADVVTDGSYEEAIVIPGRPDAEPPIPDLRRILIPLGPILVFGASNFPFAFSVLGGDTAAALAAGCPVLVKCHSGHPETSLHTLEAWQHAAAELGAPENAVQLLFGRSAGRQLVTHPHVRAVSFTGSVQVGRELHDLAVGRPDPIPFYGELAGVNPFVVTAGAAAERAEAIGRGVAASFTLNSGQFCTKPGLLFVPEGPDGDRLLAAAAAHVADLAPAVMLTAGTRDSYGAGLDALAAHPDITTRIRVDLPEATASEPVGGYLGAPALLEIAIGDLDASALRECFGPLALAVRYTSTAEVMDALSGLQGALAAAVHSTAGEEELAAEITAAVLPRVGRVVFDGYPTGVTVNAAMTHGGPWPATTNALHSSVGPTAVRRFLRPVTFQNAPASVLPQKLRDGGSAV